MLVKIKGELPEGSQSQPDCNYIKQELTIHLLAMRPISLLLDLTHLKYSFGNSLIDAFSPLFELPIFEDKYDIAFLLSDLNKIGIASLWRFDPNNPAPNIFYHFDEALHYVEEKYDNL